MLSGNIQNWWDLKKKGLKDLKVSQKIFKNKSLSAFVERKRKRRKEN